ncbi:hypothetical protein NIES4071_42680 [Calothrix sp. NIES-4071]|nr:hypothetical protein NIES4071_42680 [Calothrix sp. NIES-4071]BAZ58581.1 hypothetical protein NIES4105_42600 [Calothrix sp. NIES-4105]
MNLIKWSLCGLVTIAAINIATVVNALETSTPTLTVIVNGVRQHKSRVCLRVFKGEKGFPLDNKGEVQSGCTPITGNVVKKQFYGLKPGKYAVAVIDDENGDAKLHTDFLGIPKEGFGISRNPTVSVTSGIPKFKDASFTLDKNTTINIKMKYSLD